MFLDILYPAALTYLGVGHFLSLMNTFRNDLAYTTTYFLKCIDND
jgi:hypothetical protein